MTTLTDFLLARIAEDEAVAREASPAPWGFSADEFTDGRLWSGKDERGGSQIVHASWEHHERQTGLDLAHIVRHDPARVLAECEAKRQALSFAEAVQDDVERLAPGFADVVVFDRLARILALPYADHEDYREEWKP